MVVNWPLVKRNGEAADVANDVAEATPKTGVTSVGEVAKTAIPLPVSSVNAVFKLKEAKEPKVVALPTEVTSPVKFGIVAALPFNF